MQPLWRKVWRFLKKVKLELAYNSAISLLGIYLNKNIIKKDICTSVFIVDLFTITRTWKQPKYPSMDEWIKKMWYIHTWRKKWQHTPVFLPGKFHRQMNLVGYSPWGCKELAPTEHISTYTYNGILLSHKKNKIMPFAATWMDLKIVILSEVSQTEKGKYMTLFIHWI